MFCLKYQKLVKHFIKPSNIRHSSKFQRTNNLNTLEHNLIRETLDQSQPTITEWRELRDKLQKLRKNYNALGSIDTIILSNCQPNELDVGKSYIKFLTESGEQPNVTTLINLLKLYYKASKAGREITIDDQRDIIGMYEKFQSQFPVFDNNLGEAAIFGLVLTTDWRKSVDIMNSIKLLSKPSSATYCAIIQRAIQENDQPLAWELLNTVAAECKVVQNDVFIEYIRYCEKTRDQFMENVNKMLSFIENNEILISTPVAKELHRAFQSNGYNCSVTTVTRRGKCRTCQKHLRSVAVTDDEFNQLTSHFFENVLVGSNIFSKSTPEELQSFMSFIDKTKPYDCVIDGLNVAMSTPKSLPLEKSKNLAKVVEHFVNQRKTVLVVGRKHMLGWPKVQMNYIRQNSHLFLTDNLSKDDPFFIYSTLKSGSKTDFVTRDLIRDHAFKLEKNLKIVFRRWQQQHQNNIRWIDLYGDVTFEVPIQFDMNAHKVDDCWHIPFEDNSHCTFERNFFELQKNWLCVSKES